MKKPFPSLKNLCVAAKLSGGFAILIIIIILSSLFSILQSDSIRDHSLKGQLISAVNAELNTARHNRIAYHLTHDEVSLQANKSAIENMDKIATEGASLTWDSRTEEQSAAVVETAASMEQLTSTIKRNADNACEASQLAVVAADHTRSGGQIVWNVVSTMENITESSNKITDIISVINGISFQTNILALNAAVEAARADEQGRGFAVVAGEVRSLAQRSAQAAREIEGLIKESVERVRTGSDMANKAGNTMEQIVSSVTNVSGIMSDISCASEEQSRGIDQIGQAVAELDATTQQNAALVQESSAASSSLEQQAAQLARLVSTFKLGSEAVVQKAASAKPRVKIGMTPAIAIESNWSSF